MNEPIEPAVDDDVIDLRDEVLGGAGAAAELAAQLGDHPEVQVEGDDVAEERQVDASGVIAASRIHSNE